MLKVGLIGAGVLGKIHLGLLTSMKEIELVGFYDTNEINSSQLVKDYPIKSYSASEELIKNCDALVIATPTSTHVAYAMDCLALGKHVFIEKPVGVSVEEAYELQDQLKKSASIVQIGMVERFNPAFNAAKGHLKGIQQIFANRLAPFTTRGADVSVVMDVMIHDIDIVLSIIDSKPSGIKAFGEKIISDTYDLATATVHFENGVVAHFTASRMAERKYRLTEFIGEENIYKVDFLNKRAQVYEAEKLQNDGLSKAYLRNTEDESFMRELPVIESNAIGEELKSFISSIVDNKKVVVSLDDGIRSMELAKEIEDQINRQ